MKIIYSPQHALHNPPYEIFEGGLQVPYFEKPARAEIILNALQKKDWAEISAPEQFDLKHIQAVHDSDYLEFLRDAFEEWKREGSELGKDYSTDILIPATFPPRSRHRKPEAIAGRAGYYSTDLNAPLVAGTYQAARASANCALSGAQALLDGERVAYALCRPPGHHAGKDCCGGYCYINNACVAAKYLKDLEGLRDLRGLVAILDIDYHAGNGTQDIFYDSSDVLTISIHGDPSRAYPYFIGYADEAGAGAAFNFHRNFPLPAHTTDDLYLQTVDRAIALIQNFQPAYLVVSAGMDIFVDDPLGDFDITAEGIKKIGQHLAEMHLPTLIVQEGGYAIEALGENVVNLLTAFVQVK